MIFNPDRYPYHWDYLNKRISLQEWTLEGKEINSNLKAHSNLMIFINEDNENHLEKVVI